MTERIGAEINVSLTPFQVRSEQPSGSQQELTALFMEIQKAVVPERALEIQAVVKPISQANILSPKDETRVKGYFGEIRDVFSTISAALHNFQEQLPRICSGKLQEEMSATLSTITSYNSEVIKNFKSSLPKSFPDQVQRKQIAKVDVRYQDPQIFTLDQLNSASGCKASNLGEYFQSLNKQVLQDPKSISKIPGGLCTQVKPPQMQKIEFQSFEEFKRCREYLLQRLAPTSYEYKELAKKIDGAMYFIAPHDFFKASQDVTLDANIRKRMTVNLFGLFSRGELITITSGINFYELSCKLSKLFEQYKTMIAQMTPQQKSAFDEIAEQNSQRALPPLDVFITKTATQLPLLFPPDLLNFTTEDEQKLLQAKHKECQQGAELVNETQRLYEARQAKDALIAYVQGVAGKIIEKDKEYVVAEKPAESQGMPPALVLLEKPKWYQIFSRLSFWWTCRSYNTSINDIQDKMQKKLADSARSFLDLKPEERAQIQAATVKIDTVVEQENKTFVKSFNEQVSAKIDEVRRGCLDRQQQPKVVKVDAKNEELGILVESFAGKIESCLQHLQKINQTYQNLLSFESYSNIEKFYSECAKEIEKEENTLRSLHAIKPNDEKVDKALQACTDAKLQLIQKRKEGERIVQKKLEFSQQKSALCQKITALQTSENLDGTVLQLQTYKQELQGLLQKALTDQILPQGQQESYLTSTVDTLIQKCTALRDLQERKKTVEKIKEESVVLERELQGAKDAFTKAFGKDVTSPITQFLEELQAVKGENLDTIVASPEAMEVWQMKLEDVRTQSALAKTKTDALIKEMNTFCEKQKELQELAVQKPTFGDFVVYKDSVDRVKQELKKFTDPLFVSTRDKELEAIGKIELQIQDVEQRFEKLTSLYNRALSSAGESSALETVIREIDNLRKVPYDQVHIEDLRGRLEQIINNREWMKQHKTVGEYKAFSSLWQDLLSGKKCPDVTLQEAITLVEKAEAVKGVMTPLQAVLQKPLFSKLEEGKLYAPLFQLQALDPDDLRLQLAEDWPGIIPKVAQELSSLYSQLEELENEWTECQKWAEKFTNNAQIGENFPLAKTLCETIVGTKRDPHDACLNVANTERFLSEKQKLLQSYARLLQYVEVVHGDMQTFKMQSEIEKINKGYHALKETIQDRYENTQKEMRKKINEQMGRLSKELGQVDPWILDLQKLKPLDFRLDDAENVLKRIHDHEASLQSLFKEVVGLFKQWQTPGFLYNDLEGQKLLQIEKDLEHVLQKLYRYKGKEEDIEPVKKQIAPGTIAENIMRHEIGGRASSYRSLTEQNVVSVLDEIKKLGVKAIAENLRPQVLKQLRDTITGTEKGQLGLEKESPAVRLLESLETEIQ